MIKQHKSINLTNETLYLSKDLRKFFATVLKSYKKTNFDFKHDVVHIKTITSRNVSAQFAHAAYSNLITIKLPKVSLVNQNAQLRQTNHILGVFDDDSFKESFETCVARSFIWALEYLHSGINKDVSKLIIPNIDGLKIGERKLKEKVKKTPDLKLQDLVKRQEIWKRKMKRCENAISKLQKQIKYYKNKTSTLN